MKLMQIDTKTLKKENVTDIKQIKKQGRLYIQLANGLVFDVSESPSGLCISNIEGLHIVPSARNCIIITKG